ncbi:hypothetical protein FQN53_002911 [Emmonsiellopsis sp. PD_33]|nr:hypothetical protein FQN53_002911 [Emmonsiellopsis sp. PD_33]
MQLTAEALKQHNKTLRADPKTHSRIAAQVGREERAQLRRKRTAMRTFGESLPSTSYHPQPTSHEASDILLSLEKQYRRSGRQTIEDPIERFLTPGNSEPCYYTTQAMEDNNLEYGGSIDIRKEIGRYNYTSIQNLKSKDSADPGNAWGNREKPEHPSVLPQYDDEKKRSAMGQYPG